MDDERMRARFCSCALPALLLWCSCSAEEPQGPQMAGGDTTLAASDGGEVTTDGGTSGSDDGAGLDVGTLTPDVGVPACSTDEQCDDQNECTRDRCVSGECEFASEPQGTPCSGGVCDGTSEVDSCFVCVSDDQCGETTPRCDVASHTCVSEPLRVMSFNIRVAGAADGDNAWENRRDLAIKVITDHDPDVVGMQEVQPNQRQDFLNALPEMTAYAQAADQFGNENVILYRADRLTLEFQGTYWLSETPFEPFTVGWDATYSRNCIWGIFTRNSDGRGFYVYNTHFDHQGSIARLESAKYLVSRVEGRLQDLPAIFVGDLNADESSPPLLELNELLEDTFRVVHPEATDVGTSHGFSGDMTGAKIDYVLVEPSTIVEAAQIIHDNTDGHYPSDHFPVSAQISFH